MRRTSCPASRELRRVDVVEAMSITIHTVSEVVKQRRKAPSRVRFSAAIHPVMALSKNEWRRRVQAICVLNGMELSDLSDVVRRHGLPKNAAARAGHESDTYMPNHALALVLAEELEVPTTWFESEEWRPLLGAAGGSPVTKDDLDAGLSELNEALDEIRGELAAARRLPGHGEEGEADAKG